MYSSRTKTKEEPLTRLETLTHELTVELLERIQFQYDNGYFINSDLVHETASELFEDNSELQSLVDDVDDYLVDDVIGNIALNL